MRTLSPESPAMRRMGRGRRATAPVAARTGLRLFLVEAPGGDAEAVATVLEACHGFTRLALPRTIADGPCAVASSARAGALGRAAAWARSAAMHERTVVTGLACACEARTLEEHGFCSVAVASTRTPAVCAVAITASAWQREALRQPGRLPALPACGHPAPGVQYVLDTGRDDVLGREHIATLVAVLDTLHYLAQPAAHHRGPAEIAPPRRMGR